MAEANKAVTNLRVTTKELKFFQRGLRALQRELEYEQCEVGRHDAEGAHLVGVEHDQVSDLLKRLPQ